MNIRKWKKFRLSKYLFPTYVSMSGSSGTLHVGRDAARKALQTMLGRNVSHMRVSDTRFEWVFAEPLGKKKN